MPVEIYPSAAKIKRNGVYQNLPAFVSESDDNAAQQMIATAESSNVAQYKHEVGDYFRLNDVLYETTYTINIGDNIVVGTNCKVAVLADNISIIKNDSNTLKNTIKEFGGIESISYTDQPGRKFITSNGVITNASGTYHITEPIPVEANTEVHFKARGAASNFAMISTCDSDGSSIIPRLLGNADGQEHDYIYTTQQDEYIILGYNYSYDAVLTFLFSISPSRLSTSMVEKHAENQVTAANIKSAFHLTDVVNGVEVLSGQYMLNFDTTTNKYLIGYNKNYYQIRVDLDVINSTVIAPDFNWTISPNYYLACMTDENGVKVGGYLTGNSTTHSYEFIAVTTDGETISIDFARAKFNYPNAKYFYIGMVYTHDYKWTFSEPQKSLEWLKLTDSQINAIINDVFSQIDIVLPKKIYAVQDHQLVVFDKNIVGVRNLNDYYVRYSLTGSLISSSHQFNRFASIEPESTTPTGDYTLTVMLRNKYNSELFKSKSTVVSVIPDSAVTGKKVIFIGDSLTQAAYYPAEIQHNLSDSGITSIGTRTGTVTIGGQQLTVNHEGRSGWGSRDYCTKETFNGITNAFWNPNTSKFDFSYYMEQNSFSDIDAVVIFLGTNSTSAELMATAVEEIQEMITSIHEYDENIKIFVTPPCPSASQDGFGAVTHINGGTQGGYDVAQKKLTNNYITAFDDTETNVFFIPAYISLDTEYDYPTRDEAVTDRNPAIVTRQINQVHPSVYGYLHIADVIYNTLLSQL